MGKKGGKAGGRGETWWEAGFCAQERTTLTTACCSVVTGEW